MTLKSLWLTLPLPFICVLFQNCSHPIGAESPLASLNASLGTSSNSSKPSAYLFSTSGAAGRFLDVCYSSDYSLKIRNVDMTKNPKICATTRDRAVDCTGDLASFVTLAQVGYQQSGADFIKSNMSTEVRSIISAADAPLTFDIFYIDNQNQNPIKIGSGTIHACDDRKTFYPTSFQCPTTDVCSVRYPGYEMVANSCDTSGTGGVSVQCRPSYMEIPTVSESSFIRYDEPALNGQGNAETEESIEEPESNSPPPQQTSTSCAAPAGWTCLRSPMTMGARGGVPAGVPFQANNRGWEYLFGGNETNVVHVHPLKFDSSIYNTDSAYLVTQEWNNGRAREVVISTTPGSMTPVSTGGYGCKKSVLGLGAYINISFNGVTTGHCSLQKETQYYINVKSPTVDTPIEYLLRIQ